MKFKHNTFVYAYHGDLIYEAKILKTHKANEEFVINSEGKRETLEDNTTLTKSNYEVDKYFLHYQGWKSKWDEWVKVDRILEYNKENEIKKRKQEKEIQLLQQSQRVNLQGNESKDEVKNEQKKKKKRGRPSNKSLIFEEQEKKKLSKTVNTGNNIWRDQDSNRERYDNKNESWFESDMRNILKTVLVDDWENITREKMIVTLPSRYPVSTILMEYLEYVKTKDVTLEEISVTKIILQSLELYFNRSMGLFLLYRYERYQYLNFLKEKKVTTKNPHSETYGVEHLLRLLILLPGLMSDMNIEVIGCEILSKECEELLNFLTDNIKKYANEYFYMSPQYESILRF